MTKEEMLKKAETQLDGFESYIMTLSGTPEEPVIVSEEDERFDFTLALNRLLVHLEDLRRDLDTLGQF